MDVRKDLYLIGNGANPNDTFQLTPMEVLIKLKSFYEFTPKTKGALVWDGPIRLDSNRLGNINFMNFDKTGYFVIRPTDHGIFFHMQTEDSYASFDFDRIRESSFSISLSDDDSDVIFSSTDSNSNTNSGFRVSKKDTTKIYYAKPILKEKEVFFCDYVFKLIDVPVRCFERADANFKNSSVSKKTLYAANLESLDMRVKVSDKSIKIKTVFKKNMGKTNLEKILYGMSLNQFNVSRDRDDENVIKETTVSFNPSNTYEAYQYLNALAIFDKEK